MDDIEGLSVEETREEIRERLSFRLLRGLADAADLVSWVRTQAVPSDGRVERSEDMPQASTPLRTGAADDADLIYALLVSWVWCWADLLKVDVPRLMPPAWRRTPQTPFSDDLSDVQGFRAGTTPLEAHSAVWRLSAWLVDHHQRIREFDLFTVYAEELVAILGQAYGHYPRKDTPRMVARRGCPICGEAQVVAMTYGTSTRVWCQHCGADTEELRAELGVPRARLSWLFRWLQGDDIPVEECVECHRRAVRGELIRHEWSCRFSVARVGSEGATA